MTYERTRPLLQGDGAVDIASLGDPRERDIGLITDELMQEASPAAVAEIRERTLRDPEFRQRRELLHSIWNARSADEDQLVISDDRIAEANLWRRIREQETRKAAANDDGGRPRIGEDTTVPALSVGFDAEPERWYRVLPASWLARIAIYAVLGVAAIVGSGWIIHRVVADQQAAHAYQLAHPRDP